MVYGHVKGEGPGRQPGSALRPPDGYIIGTKPNKPGLTLKPSLYWTLSAGEKKVKSPLEGENI